MKGVWMNKGTFHIKRNACEIAAEEEKQEENQP